MSPDKNPNSSDLLENLGLLVGRWKLDLAFPGDPPNVVQGEATFDWLEAGGFAIQRLGDSSWIIGPDDSSGEYGVLYHDGRGVSRVYQMSLGHEIVEDVENLARLFATI